MSDISRKSFEEWYKGDMNWPLRFHRESNSKKSYTFSGTEKAWQAWQAGRKALEDEVRAWKKQQESTELTGAK